MLDPWALQQKRWKKRLYSLLVEHRTLAEASCLRAITQNEAAQYREFGLSNPIAVVPNGVTVPQDISPETFWQHFPRLREKKIILFLGRLHPKKGLIPLCQAWRHIAHTISDAHLVLAGPDCDGTEQQLRAIVESTEVGSSVTFTGLVYGALKWSAYAAAHSFILPSFSEGFSVAVLEALGTGTPAILSEACYFPEAIESGAGWLTGTTELEIAGVLETVLATHDQDRNRMGHAGARLIRERYSWPRIATELSDVNDWLLGGPLPSSLNLK
jgi:glycosyltransferase involved in cell wall biosynthesis